MADVNRPPAAILAQLMLALGACGGGNGEPPPADGSLDAPLNAADATTDAGMTDGGSSDGGGDARAPDDATTDAADSAPPRQDGCIADMDLGSATGVDVAVGNTVGGENRVYPECSPPRGSSPDVIYRWRAPNAGTWVFDTLGSSFDTVIHVRDLECTLLACSDNFVRNLLSRTTVDLEEGEEVYVVVDGATGDAGEFRLSIDDALPAELACGDGLDNDRDGLTDCADVGDCMDVGPCVETDCTDGMDNDSDTFLDCQDPNCADIEPCAESFCDDGVDGDGDFLVDCADSDCDDNEPCGESICDDGIDGDMNGLTDCEEAACTCAPNCLPPDPCPEEDLGSAVGTTVASGVTGGCPLRAPPSTECGGYSGVGTGPEKTYLWTAPEAGTFTFDTSGSSFDTSLYVLTACDGAILGCNEDIVPGALQRSRVTLDLAAGQSVVVVVDGWGGDSGSFVLNVLQGT